MVFTSSSVCYVRGGFMSDGLHVSLVWLDRFVCVHASEQDTKQDI